MSEAPSLRRGESRTTCPLPDGEGAAIVRVCAPCRLHFGMFSFGHANRPQFGGVGVMIEPPNVAVRFSPANRFSVRGDHAGRVRQFITSACGGWQVPSPKCCVVVDSPPDHTGLGVGTQLGLAVAAGLRRFLRLPSMSSDNLAISIGRGLRSAVGTYGFQLGGLIVDAGKQGGEGLAKLAERAPVPEEWRFVLVRPSNEHGLAGEGEAAAFGRLPPVPVTVTEELWRITTDEMLPAIKVGRCEEFGDAVHRFGRLAGECFSAAQGGPFASVRVAELVERIRAFGIAGVGQSSWGPTVFAVAADESQAEQLVKWVHERGLDSDCDVAIARANNCGAVIEEVSSR